MTGTNLSSARNLDPSNLTVRSKRRHHTRSIDVHTPTHHRRSIDPICLSIPSESQSIHSVDLPTSDPVASILNMSANSTPRIIIASAGMSGLCLAIKLKQAGIDTFTIFEKSDDVGGTWLDNSYPNAGCDIPSFLYSFSFAPKLDWSQKYARQPEILQYFREVADRFELRPHIRFGRSIEHARFHEQTGVWSVETDDGQDHECDFFISAVGQLNRPAIPHFEGLSEFEGRSWHSARWNHNAEIVGKRIAVIGNGASSIQFLPEVCDEAASVTLFQRTPNWIHPLHNYRYPAWAHWAFHSLPLAARLHRLWIFLMCEWRFIAFANGDNLANRVCRRWLTWKANRQVPPDMRPEVIPDYPPGCKRILLSSDYFQTLQRDNVELTSEPIERFEKTGIRTADRLFDIDTVIFATGFETSAFLQPMRITGKSGQELHDEWAARPRTLFGLTTAGFPNMFMLYGPNTNLGHNSIIYMVECQVNFLVSCIRESMARKAKYLEVTESALDEYDQSLRRRLGKTVWAGDCSSWYKTEAGDITNNWWGTATAYWLRTRTPDFRHFRFSTTPAWSS